MSLERAIPLVQIIDQALTSTNNNDGTYEVEHAVSVRNVGEVAIPNVTITTDFASVFDSVLVSDVVIDSTCSSNVRPGTACRSTQRATLRPGAAVGPYVVAVEVASADAQLLDALVLSLIHI